MLESVARAHLGKLDRLAALETADGIAANDGRACDRVMGWARRLQASQGIAAPVGDPERRVLAASGLTQEEIDEVGWTLDLLRKSARCKAFNSDSLVEMSDCNPICRSGL
jgi:hypothetical protein